MSNSYRSSGNRGTSEKKDSYKKNSYKGMSDRKGSYKDLRRKDRAEKPERKTTLRQTEKHQDVNENPNRLEGKNAVLEAFRSGRTVDKVYLQENLHDGMIMTIAR